MLEYYAQHPLYAVLIIALALVALFVLAKAVKSSAKHSREFNERFEKMKTENELINKYAVLTESIIDSAEPAELFRAVGASLQKRVADKADMAAEFESCNDSQKYIYSFYTFLEDGEKEMSNFFRINTKPLTLYAYKAAQAICGSEFVSLFEQEYNAFDGDNEDVSYIKSEIEELDEKAKPAIQAGTLYTLAGEYIKNNKSDFIISA